MSGHQSDLPDLPDDVMAEIAPHLDAPQTVLAAIGVELARKREEARSERSQSGIEDIWRDAEDAYLGIDDANRHEFTSRMQKPTSIDGPVTTGRRDMATDRKSTVFLRLTSRYVDAGAAKLGEILLPADDKSFSFSEMPVPELIAASKDESQVVHSDLGVPLTRPMTKDEAAAAPAAPASTPMPPAQTAPQPPPAAPGQPGVAPAPAGGVPNASPVGGAPAAAGGATPAAAAAPPRVPLTVKDLAIENIELARKRAKAAETRIYDWMVQTRYRAEIRKVIGDSARMGVGVVKGPVPEKKRVMVLTTKGDEVRLVIKDKIVPASKWVNPWNIFPDPACGENIHDGDYVFERDFMSARQVRGLKVLPGYIAKQIDQVLVEGPNKANTNSGRGDRLAEQQKGRFEIWYFYGSLTRDEMAVIDQAAGKPAAQSPDEMPDEVHAIVTLINDCVVRATINPLDSGDFPYHSMPWQRRAEHWAGVGVAEQIKAAQRITNASLRALLNNAGKSAGSQLVVDMMAIRPADGDWTITPDKIWEKTQEGPQDVRQAFMAVQIPNVTEQMMQIVTMGERFAEESTSIPLITQGQSGATTPDTFGAAQLQNNNANQLLRSIGYAFDDYITEPQVNQYYEWLLLDPEVPNEEKGEFQIDAHGSAALVERAIQDQTIGQMGNMAANPIYGIDPKKWAKMFLKSKRLSPDDVQYTEQEQAKLDAQPPPEAPAVTVAKINQDTAMKQLAAKQTGEQASQQSDERIAQAANVLEGGHVQNEQQRIHVDATVKLHELQTRRELAMLDYANRMHVSLAQAKVDLARTAMELQTERELNATNNAIDLHKHRTQQQQPPRPRGRKPPVQAPGRAGNGQAFDQAPAQ